MKTSSILILALPLLSTLFTGCVTGRRVVDLPVASAAATREATKGDIRIVSVTDARMFENKPRDPSTPSIDGDVNALTPAQKDVMIGRQRNGFGKAMGDISLSEGDTVTQRVRLLVEQGLQQHGYRISKESSAPNSIDVAIDRFWAWGTPGMWSVSFEARVGCKLKIQSPTKTATIQVEGYGINHGQVAKNANWQLAYERAFNDFAAHLGTALTDAGF